MVDIPVRELSDVKSLKQRLQQVHGLPPRFRQRISSRGSILEDTAKLDSSMDLELVLLPCSVASQAQADELVTATHSASEVEAILLQPLHPDVVDSNGRSPLWVSAEQNHVEVMRLLLEASANTNLANHEGETALMKASHAGHLEAARLLVEAGAETNLRNSCGTAALTMASKADHVEVARLLLEASADKDSRNYQDETPLMLASEEGHVEVLQLLLEAGADTSLARYSITPLRIASANGHVEPR